MSLSESRRWKEPYGLLSSSSHILRPSNPMFAMNALVNSLVIGRAMQGGVEMQPEAPRGSSWHGREAAGQMTLLELPCRCL